MSPYNHELALAPPFLFFFVVVVVVVERFFPLVLPIPDYHSKTCPRKLTRENVTEMPLYHLPAAHT